MTEKRYSRMMNHYGTSRTYCTGIYDNQNNRELENSSQVIYELNALHEENQRLEKQKQHLIDYMDTWCPKRFYNGILRAMEEIE